MDKEFVNSVKDKSYSQLNDDERKKVIDIMSKYKLSSEQRDKIFISFLFGDTIKTAFKKINNGSDLK